jgi:PTH2 family peptidyl-tRNA hydrolase
MEFRYKQVILVRTDLRMGRGKIAVQVAHAAVSTALKAQRERREWFDIWIREGQAKVVLKVRGIEELLEYKRMAEDKGLPVELISDRGLTQLKPGTVTCLGIGPAPSDMIDEITGDLKLL